MSRIAHISPTAFRNRKYVACSGGLAEGIPEYHGSILTTCSIFSTPLRQNLLVPLAYHSSVDSHTLLQIDESIS